MREPPPPPPFTKLGNKKHSSRARARFSDIVFTSSSVGWGQEDLGKLEEIRTGGIGKLGKLEDIRTGGLGKLEEIRGQCKLGQKDLGNWETGRH